MLFVAVAYFLANDANAQTSTTKGHAFWLRFQALLWFFPITLLTTLGWAFVSPPPSIRCLLYLPAYSISSHIHLFALAHACCSVLAPTVCCAYPRCLSPFLPSFLPPSLTRRRLDGETGTRNYAEILAFVIRYAIFYYFIGQVGFVPFLKGFLLSYWIGGDSNSPSLIFPERN